MQRSADSTSYIRQQRSFLMTKHKLNITKISEIGSSGKIYTLSLVSVHQKAFAELVRFWNIRDHLGCSSQRETEQHLLVATAFFKVHRLPQGHQTIKPGNIKM